MTTTPPRPRRPIGGPEYDDRRHLIDVAVLKNVLGLLLLLVAAAGVVYTLYLYDYRLALGVGSLIIGAAAWPLLTSESSEVD